MDDEHAADEGPFDHALAQQAAAPAAEPALAPAAEIAEDAETSDSLATERARRLHRAGLPLTDLGTVLAEESGPLLFATVSGAHLYGFPSTDSDVDLRGAHLLPVAELIGLHEPDETRSRTWDHDGVEMDLVSHDLRKFVRMMMRRNGYVLEQLHSPLVVHSTEAHRELLSLAPGVLTGHHAHHYRGFAATQWRLFEKTGELKPLLYTFRALLTGVHLMRSGEVQAHLPTLLGEVSAPDYLPELIEAKAEAEHGAATGLAPTRLQSDVDALHEVLAEARAETRLPDAPAGYEALHDLVVRTRLER